MIFALRFHTVLCSKTLSRSACNNKCMKVTKQYQKKTQPHKSLKHAQIYNVRTNKTKWYKMNLTKQKETNKMNKLYRHESRQVSTDLGSHYRGSEIRWSAASYTTNLSKTRSVTFKVPRIAYFILSQLKLYLLYERTLNKTRTLHHFFFVIDHGFLAGLCWKKSPGCRQANRQCHYK